SIFPRNQSKQEPGLPGCPYFLGSQGSIPALRCPEGRGVSKTSPKVISHAGRSGALSPEMRDWPTEELLRIRLVLKRLTALRVKNPDDAEDLVQEALLTMTQKFPEIELHKGLMVWGMGILRKKVGNYYRRCRPPESLDQEARSLRIA